MITYEPNSGYGNIDEALEEARCLVQALEDAQNVASYFAEFPRATEGLCSERGDRVFIEVIEHQGRLQIIAREGTG
jgi:hypothetical protein